MALAFLDYAKYGVQTTFYISFEDGSDATELYTGTDFAAGDVKISKDGGALANTTNLPAQITGSQPGYSITLTAAEMQAGRVFVTMRDASAAVWRGVTLTVVTKMTLGQVDVDATQIGGSANAMLLQAASGGTGLKAVGGANGNGIWGATSSGNGFGIVGTGIGTGDGINGTGGNTAAAGIRGAAGTAGTGILGISATLGAGIWGIGSSDASVKWAGILGTGQTDGGAGVVGIAGTGLGAEAGLKCTGGTTGNGITAAGGATSGDGISATTVAGNSNGITASGRGTGKGFNTVHATDNSLMTNLFDTLEGTEPAGAVASNATFKQILQYLKRRFFNKVTQTSTVRTYYKDDSVTSLQTQTCSNDGTTQTQNKAS